MLNTSRVLIAMALLSSATTLAQAQPKRERGWLGVALDDAKAPPELARRGNPPVARVVVVSHVFAASPAEHAGVRKGDVALALDGARLLTIEQMVTAVGRRKPGSKVALEVWRGGKRRTLVATLGLRPDPEEAVRRRWQDKLVPASLTFEDARSKKPLTVGSLRGRPLILEYWSTSCPPCRRAEPWLRTLERRYVTHRLRVVSVTEDERQDVEAYLAGRPELAHTVALDPNEVIDRELHLFSMPTFFYVDAAGVVRGISFGAESLEKMDALVRQALPAPSRKRAR